MDIEQLDLGDQPPDRDREPARLRANPLTWITIAVIALVSGFFVLSGGSVDPDPDLDSHRGSAPSPSEPADSSAPPVRPDQRQYLGVTMICAPVTDGHRRLELTFEVSNVSPSPVTVASVAAVLPEGGLRQRGPATRGGDCDQGGTSGPRGSIAAGESAFYTLVLDLPKTCPARYPVQVRIRFSAVGFDETSLSILYSDLSVLDFDTCGPDAASPSPRSSAASPASVLAPGTGARPGPARSVDGVRVS